MNLIKKLSITYHGVPAPDGLPVKFDLAAKCPRFLQFLKETFEGKPELIDFLQRSVGYGLTGSIAEQCFWLLIGAGNNGKSVLLRTLGHLLGDYAVETSFDTFAAKRTTTPVSPRDGLASLKGSRFVHASESDQGRKFSEAQLKALTGGEKVRTAKMYEEDFAYQPTFKLWLSTNHDPTITGTDDGVYCNKGNRRTTTLACIIHECLSGSRCVVKTGRNLAIVSGGGKTTD